VMFSFVPEAVLEGYRCVWCSSVLGADAFVHATSGDMMCGSCARVGVEGGGEEVPVFHKAPKMVYALLDALPVVCDVCGATETGDGGSVMTRRLFEDVHAGSEECTARARLSWSTVFFGRSDTHCRSK